MNRLIPLILVLIALAVAIALAPTGCSSDDDDDDDDDTSPGADDDADDDDVADDDADDLGTDGICQIFVDCQFFASIDQCNASYFDSCIGEDWDEAGALECINTLCLPDYSGDAQTCATFLTCTEDCIYEQNGCL